jgi:hypothetical protein
MVMARSPHRDQVRDDLLAEHAGLPEAGSRGPAILPGRAALHQSRRQPRPHLGPDRGRTETGPQTAAQIPILSRELPRPPNPSEDV